jgi:hypothetical protein
MLLAYYGQWNVSMWVHHFAATVLFVSSVMAGSSHSGCVYALLAEALVPWGFMLFYLRAVQWTESRLFQVRAFVAVICPKLFPGCLCDGYGDSGAAAHVVVRCVLPAQLSPVVGGGVAMVLLVCERCAVRRLLHGNHVVSVVFAQLSAFGPQAAAALQEHESAPGLNSRNFCGVRQLI